MTMTLLVKQGELTCVVVEADGRSTHRLTPGEARSLGDALLAGARRAEEVQKRSAERRLAELEEKLRIIQENINLAREELRLAPLSWHAVSPVVQAT